MFREFLRVPPAAIASAADLGTWVRLYVCAAEIERGGRLPGSIDWTDRQWLAYAHVTRAEVAAAIAAGLITTDSPDLLVVGYDVAGEKRVQTVRENGRQPAKEGRRRGRPKTSAKPGGNPSENQDGNRRETNGESHENPELNPYSGSGSVSSAITITPSEAGPSGSGSGSAGSNASSDAHALYPRSAELYAADPRRWLDLVELHALRKAPEAAKHEAMEQILAERVAS